MSVNGSEVNRRFCHKSSGHLNDLAFNYVQYVAGLRPRRPLGKDMCSRMLQEALVAANIVLVSFLGELRDANPLEGKRL